MSQQDSPLTDNQATAAVCLLADELAVPANTIEWIWSCVTTLTMRKQGASRHSGAREICAALLRDLNGYYTGDIETGLRETGLLRSEDIGRVICGLTSKQILKMDENDSVSDFDGLFQIDSVDAFLNEEGIKRKRITWSKFKRTVSRVCYFTGTALVLASYADLVSPEAAWTGWGIGMFGFILSYFPDPTPERY